MPTHRECACLRCVMACMIAPGLLMRDDVARIAEYLHIPVDELLETRLDVHASGAVQPKMTPNGCTFLVNQRCSIHAVKPFECREAMHDLTPDQGRDIVKRALADWNGDVSAFDVFNTPRVADGVMRRITAHSPRCLSCDLTQD